MGLGKSHQGLQHGFAFLDLGEEARAPTGVACHGTALAEFPMPGWMRVPHMIAEEPTTEARIICWGNDGWHQHRQCSRVS